MKNENSTLKRKSIKTNFIFNIIKVLLSLIFPLITFPYASRILLPDGIGKVDFANSIIAYFLLIASLGINTYAIREGAKVRDDKEKLSNFFQEILIINTITTVIAYIALFACIYMIPDFYEYRELLLITGLTIGFSTLGIEWLYGALEEYKYITIRSFIFNIISLILLFICVRTQDDYINYAIIQVIANVGSNIMNFINSRKFVSFRKTKKYNFKRHIKPILVIFGLNLACNIYMNFDKTCLGILSGDESVGLYTAALKINRIVLSLITALGTVLLPRLSYYLENNKLEEFNVLIKKAFNFVFMFSLPSAVGLYLLSTPIISIMSGEAYLQASITMKILTAIIPIISISNLIAVQIFIPFGKEKYALISSSVAAIINLIANLILIPKFYQNGAAIGTVLAEGMALVICIFLCKKIVRLEKITKYLKQYIAGTMLIIITYLFIVKLIKPNIMLTLIMCLIGTIEYMIFLFVCKNEYLIEFYKQIKNKIFKKRKEEKNMNLDYIIIQAGGKGTRMDYLTKNKPKSLVPINNLPMMFHLFKKYPEKKYIIIGDYKIDVLRKYLDTFAKVQYIIVDGSKEKGTCAGIGQALKYIPEQKTFMLIWSDLILPQEYNMPQEGYNYLGISKDFRCRWKYEKQKFEESPSEEHGVAGLFIFKEKKEIKDVPKSGEFVKWLQQIEINFKELPLHRTKEYGLIEEYKKLEQNKCRPFNKITVVGDRIIKEGIDDQGKKLAIREKEWYKHVKKIGFKNIPEIYEMEPLTLEKINGKNIYEYEQVSIEQKRIILEKIVNSLKELHKLEKQEVDYFSIKENYINKTFDRLNKVRSLIPYADKEYIKINGKQCRNVFFYKEQLEKKIEELDFKEFRLIHGDCTFSNLMLKKNEEPILIDPRGYFGNTEIYGDPAYDWAKLYYSIKGNYDKFNLKKFKLDIKEEGIELIIESNKWEELEKEFFKLIENEVSVMQIKLIHAIIWLSLTTYAWEDYDSICGAFYNGLYYLEEVL